MSDQRSVAEQVADLWRYARDNGMYDAQGTTPPSVRGPVVAGQPAADRLMQALDYRLHPHARPLTRDEVAVVLHALADHTALCAGLTYSPPPDGFWPEATSLGRWLHDTADQLEIR